MMDLSSTAKFFDEKPASQSDSTVQTTEKPSSSPVTTNSNSKAKISRKNYQPIIMPVQHWPTTKVR